ncbi:MAG: hypothetical protein GY913_07980 [Proteobacteria bacterium]|nr:hypothetical protein [Pseudomonadota bacterium]MCP4916851.1 hypothetical protein [Pseudomonadota bacterium]
MVDEDGVVTFTTGGNAVCEAFAGVHTNEPTKSTADVVHGLPDSACGLYTQCMCDLQTAWTVQGGPPPNPFTDACTDRDFDQMYADDLSGCHEKTENCLDTCGDRCGECEAECATACVACGQGKEECTAARVACSDSCLAARTACHTKCSDRGDACYERFDKEIGEACPDCMEMSECMMDGCTEKFPDFDDRCMAWCFAG